MSLGIYFGSAFGTNKGGSDGEKSPSMENLGEDGEHSPSIFLSPPKKHLQGWKALHIYYVSTRVNS
jgi:hypothetical protein